MPTLVSTLKPLAGRMLPACIVHPAITNGAGFGVARYAELENPMSSSITAPGPTGTLPGLG